MTPGPLLFARYAYPPNALGYCGSDAADTLLEYGAAGSSDGGLVELARSFEGAMPYLELIASASSYPDPLSAPVVDAYWVGNALLEHVDMARFGSHLEERFRDRVGRRWGRALDAVAAGGLPHHNFHVFCVYPWVGLLREGAVEHPLHVLEQCRIRWGRVESVNGDTAVVRSKPLEWAGEILRLGPERPEPVTVRTDGRGFIGRLAPGERVSIHWGWICDRLTSAQCAQLSFYTDAILSAVNKSELARALDG